MLHTSKPQHAESNALFARYQTGDTNALGELYNRWNAFVCKKISNVFKTPEDIEDVASDVWVRVQREAHKWDLQKKNFYNFLYLHIRYCIAEALRVRNTVKGGRNYTDIRYSLDAETDSQEFIETHIASIDVDVLESLIFKEQLEIVSKAIAVCKFPKETQQILQLSMKGWTHKEIQQRLGFNCAGSVSVRLSNAINEIRQAINLSTWEVSPLSPRERRERQKKHLAKQSGANLAKLCKSKKWGARELARILNLRVDTLLEYLKGDRTPDAPLLKNLAGILGRDVYTIFAPPLTDGFPYCREGRRLWYQRVRRGLSFARAEELTGVSAGQIFNYEKGKVKPKPQTRAKLEKAYCVYENFLSVKF